MSMKGARKPCFFKSHADQVSSHCAENAEANLPIAAPRFYTAQPLSRRRFVQLDLDLMRPMPGHRHMPRIFALTSTFGPSDGIRWLSAVAMGQAVRSNWPSSAFGMKRVRLA